MRILHVIATLDPAAGGPPAVVVHLAAAQAGLGHAVDVLSYETAVSGGKLADWTTRVPNWASVNVHLLSPPGRFERAFAWNAQRRLKTLLADADVVHLHEMWTPITKRAAEEAERLHTPYVLAPHGMLHPFCFAQKRWKKRLAMALVFRRILARASFLHLFYPEEEQQARVFGAERFEVIPNGICFEEIEPLPPPGVFYKQHPELGGQPFILFVGRLHPIKGLDSLVSAFANIAGRFPEVRLVLMGPDSGERNNLERQAAQLGVAARVHLIGPVYGADKFAALVDAMCFCLPSKHEAASMSILEALACSLPVIISDKCHFPEIAEAQAGEIVQLDPEPIAQALSRVIADPDYRRRLGQAGRQLIETGYTWDRIAEKSIRAYRKVLPGGDVPGGTDIPVGAGTDKNVCSTQQNCVPLCER